VPTTGIRTSSSIVAVAEKAAATTGVLVSSAILAVAEKTRLLPAFYTCSIRGTWLLLVYGSEVLVAVVKETWLLPAFGSLVL